MDESNESVVTAGRRAKDDEIEHTSLDNSETENSNDEQTIEGEKQNPEAKAYLDHLLQNGCNEGDSGTDLEMPLWYNENLFLKGQKCFQKYRFVIQSGMLSGLIAVLAIPSILRVLMCTRQSNTPATAYRRYVRTILHVIAWYNYSPKSKKSKFWTSIRAVRKAHSRSSRASDKLGAGQITQKDLALTQFGFIGFLTLGASRIQLDDNEFLESTSHMWRVLGYLLGIKDEYNICGENWSETKNRLDIVIRKVYAPSLENTDENFKKMTKALLEGLWPVNNTLTVDSFLYFTKRLAYVKGYEYYDFDYRPGTKKDAKHRRNFYALSKWDQFLVRYGLFMVTYLHKYRIIRWYLNFRVWINEMFMYYLPYIAFWQYSIKWSYVRIFNSDNTDAEFEYHLKDE